jgi:osmotically inducible protein OsmC
MSSGEVPARESGEISSIAERSAEPTCEGSPADGNGERSGSSGALDGLPVTWAARTESPDQPTSPEELTASLRLS